MDTADKILTAEFQLKKVFSLVEEAQEEIKQMKTERKASNIELTNGQAGRMLGVSKRTIIRMKQDGRLHSLKFLDVFEYMRSQQ